MESSQAFIRKKKKERKKKVIEPVEFVVQENQSIKQEQKEIKKKMTELLTLKKKVDAIEKIIKYRSSEVVPLLTELKCVMNKELENSQNKLKQSERHFNFWDQAEKEMSSLIRIRKEWDKYIVSESVVGSSRVPPFYPEAPVLREDWAQCLKNV